MKNSADLFILIGLKSDSFVGGDQPSVHYYPFVLKAYHKWFLVLKGLQTDGRGSGGDAEQLDKGRLLSICWEVIAQGE